ncbi:STAS domain-containing protein [Streptomyces sp. SID14478]|uniref:STAS domain-containing protein n=1 Tax=Streptomyces sp. SID14478 TaxID=2706073 RepID=UPI0013DF76E7|nr:STAS domain-containing protein [Streptomyces sp. SID14478]NEB81911.1 STAS domain-containing protein [Streptomyces sp. SID14478]
MTSHRVDTHVKRNERTAIVVLGGEADLHATGQVVGALQEALQDEDTDATLIDLSGLTFADSVLLNQLLTAHADHEAKGRPVLLAGPLNPAVGRLFEITGTDAVLPLVDDVETGLRRLH